MGGYSYIYFDLAYGLKYDDYGGYDSIYYYGYSYDQREPSVRAFFVSAN